MAAAGATPAAVPEPAGRRPKVVIIGAGFGGLSAAKALAREPVDVTLVDRHNFHTFLPLLYQVATAGLNAADVAYAVRGIFRRQANVTFRQAFVTAVDWDARQLSLAMSNDDQPGPRRDVSAGSGVSPGAGPAMSMPFDYLIVAAGSSTNFFGVEGAETRAFPLYSLTDAVALRNHIIGRFEVADTTPALIDDGALSFVVVGGGPTGVEVAGALIELFDAVLRKDFRHLDVSRARVILVEMGDELLPPFGPRARRHARETLVARGVEVHTGEAVQAVTETRVTLRSGEELPAHTLIWAAGVQANHLADVLGVARGRGGRIVVGSDLAIPDHPCAYAIGDIAEITDSRHGILPQLAPVAMQSGRHAAEQIVRSLHDQPHTSFRYRNKGTMATIGRRAAVAELPGHISLRGTLAWFAWLGLHLIELMGFRNRLSVLLNWAWNYFTWDRGPRLILRQDSKANPPDPADPANPRTGEA